MARNTAATGGAGKLVRRAVVVGKVTYPYQVFVPAVHSREKSPAILFLHGSDERGNDGVRQTTVGLGPTVMRRALDFPAIVVLPQLPLRCMWSGLPARAALAALDAAMKEFGGDPDRVYLTGISMGAYGVWDIALRDPKRFAALVPICGGLQSLAALPSTFVREVVGLGGDVHDHAAKKLANIPVWIFHGSADRNVPVEESRVMADAMRRAGANVQYTEYEGVGHNSWDPAYADAGFWTWLFDQRRH